jgi:hypothetical protein
MNTQEINNLFKNLRISQMNKIILITFTLISSLLSAQEGPGGRQNAVSLLNNSCIVTLNIGDPSCNHIKFCYDESGNRIVRYRQICMSAVMGGGGPISKFVKDTSLTMGLLEATTIYPNPTQGSTTIEFDKEIEDGKVDLIDMEGRSISSHSFAGKKTYVDLSKQAAGTYYIIISRNKEKVMKAVVRE